MRKCTSNTFKLEYFEWKINKNITVETSLDKLQPAVLSTVVNLPLPKHIAIPNVFDFRTNSSKQFALLQQVHRTLIIQRYRNTVCTSTFQNVLRGLMRWYAVVCGCYAVLCVNTNAVIVCSPSNCLQRSEKLVVQVGCGAYPLCLEPTSAVSLWSVHQGSLLWLCISGEDCKLLMAKGLLKQGHLLQHIIAFPPILLAALKKYKSSSFTITDLVWDSTPKPNTGHSPLFAYCNATVSRHTTCLLVVESIQHLQLP